MPTKHVVDTHAFLWYLAGESQLGGAARAVLEDSESELIIPAIVLAESCWIVDRGRAALTVLDLWTAIDNDPRIKVIPLDRTIIERSNSLVNVGEMHDRQILSSVSLGQLKPN